MKALSLAVLVLSFACSGGSDKVRQKSHHKTSKGRRVNDVPSKRRPVEHESHEHEHGPHPHGSSPHHHHPHPHPHLEGQNGHHHPY